MFDSRRLQVMIKIEVGAGHLRGVFLNGAVSRLPRFVPYKCGGGQLSMPFGTREELTTPARQKLTTNRPRVRCLSDEHGLVALGLAARPTKGPPLNLFSDLRACGADEEGSARRHATWHDQFLVWSSLFK